MCLSCETKKPLLEQIFDESDNEIFQHVISDPDKYEVQVLYTRILRNAAGEITLESHSFNRDDSQYFYPASTIKMPIAFLALQYINELKSEYSQIDERSRIVFDSISPPQSGEEIDTCSTTGFPNVSHYIDKIFSISDNNASNRLYELMGQDYINNQLREKGIFRNSRIRHRVGVSGFDTESNKYTNAWRMYDDNDQVIYDQNEQYARYDDFAPVNNTMKGEGYYDDDSDTTIMVPFDMSEKNFINLYDLLQCLIRVIVPEKFDSSMRFNLTEQQYDRLWNSMTSTPKDYDYLKANEEYYDSYVKFLIYGDTKDTIPDYMNIANKVGWAYGYLTDCAYIRDTLNEIDFFLAATISVNENQIYNDGIYEYEKIGIPFLAELGRLIYHTELEKKK